MPLFVQTGLNLVTPSLIANNVTFVANATNTYTCTGGTTGVPLGVHAVFLHIFFTPSVAGTSARITPHSTAWSVGLYPQVGESVNATNIVAGDILCQVDSGGQVDVKSNVGACLGFYLGVTGFVY